MGFKLPVADKLDGSKKNVPQNTVVIRQAEKKDAETVFQMIRALAEYHGEDAEFRATLKDVQRDGFDKHPIYESWLAEIDGVPWWGVDMDTNVRTRPRRSSGSLIDVPGERRYRASRPPML